MTKQLRLYLHDIDTRLCISVNKTSHFKLVRLFFRLISRLGDGIFWYATMIGIVVANGNDGVPATLHMLGGGLLGLNIYRWLKSKTLRPRPYQIHQDIWLSGHALDQFSFPSGNTLQAVLMSTVAVFYYPVLALPLMLFTGLIAISRIVLGLHYPSDVIAGALLGYSIAQLVLLI